MRPLCVLDEFDLDFEEKRGRNKAIEQVNFEYDLPSHLGDVSAQLPLRLGVIVM